MWWWRPWRRGGGGRGLRASAARVVVGRRILLDCCWACGRRRCRGPGSAIRMSTVREGGVNHWPALIIHAALAAHLVFQQGGHEHHQQQQRRSRHRPKRDKDDWQPHDRGLEPRAYRHGRALLPGEGIVVGVFLNDPSFFFFWIPYFIRLDRSTRSLLLLSCIRMWRARDIFVQTLPHRRHARHSILSNSKYKIYPDGSSSKPSPSPSPLRVPGGKNNATLPFSAL